jgi:AcrR family transcriptional regulator
VTAPPARRTGRPPSTVNGQTVPERLLDVARTLFAEKGFEGTSVQDVVAAAGVTKGAMYHYFGSKDDLLYEIYARVLRMQMARLEKVAAQEGPIEERVHAACADVVATTVENLASTTIFFRSLHQLTQEKQKEVRRERRRYHQTFRAMIIEGQESGVFRDDISADLCVDYFFGSVHHLPMWWKPRGRLSGREVGRSFADLFLAGVTRR